MKRVVMMDENDIVATALYDIPARDKIDVYDMENENVMEFEVLEHIPYGNKVALKDIKKDEDVIKYNGVIGKATRDIKKGQLVHVHNVRSLVVDVPVSIKNEIMRQMNIK